MKSPYLIFSACLACFLFSDLSAQDLTLFPNLLIKGEPYVADIAQTSDGNYLLSGYFDHVNTTHVGNLVKVDQSGNAIQSFKPVYVDNHIVKIVVLPTGKILIAGWFTSVNGVQGSVARLNADGTSDASFQNFVLAGSSYSVYSIAVQSDGKILVAGSFSVGAYNGLVRLNSDGSIDNTFTPLAGGLLYAFDLKLDAADNIFVSDNQSLFKYAPGGGAVLSGFPATVNTNGNFSQFELMGNQIVVGGTFTAINGVSTKNVAVINGDGTMGSFAIPSAIDGVTRVTVTSDNKILVSTSFNVKAYDNTGLFLKDIASAPSGTQRVFVDKNNKILVSGGIGLSSKGVLHPFMFRLNDDFTIDNSFTCQPTNTGGVTMIAPYADGRILIAAGASGINDVNERFVRLTSDGVVDNSFRLDVQYTNIQSFAVQEDGKILLCAGQFTRLNASGSRDNSFPSIVDQSSVFSKVKIRENNIFLSGYFYSVKEHVSPGMVKLKADGSVDLTFSSALPPNCSPRDFSFQSDGKIIVAGDFTSNTSSTPNQLIRLNADGSLDDTFTIGKTLYLDGIDRIAVDSLDRIYVSGSFFNYNQSNRDRLIRLSKQGAVDLTFNPDISPYGLNPNFDGLEILSTNEIFVGTSTGYSGKSMAVYDALGIESPRSYTALSNQSSVLTSYFNGETLYLAGRFSPADYNSVSGIAYVNINPVVGGIDNLTASWVTPSTSHLTWTNTIIHGTAIIVERSTADNSHFAPVDTISVTATTYDDVTVNGGSSYYYRLKGINTHSTTPYSLEALLSQEQSQTITFSAIPDKFNTDPFIVSATASSGLPVTVTSSDPSIASVDGMTISIHKGGSVTLIANQTGNQIYDAAKPVSVSFTIILPVGVEASVAEVENVNAYPNPSNGLFEVQLNADFQGGNYSIISSDGIVRQNEKTVTIDGKLLVDLSSFDTGLYLLQIKSQGKDLNLKLVKQ